MAEKGRQNEKYGAADTMDSAPIANNPEPVATEPLQYVGSESDLSSREPEKEEGVHRRPMVDRALTTTTTTSSVLPQMAAAEPVEKKPWYKRMNPLKRSKKPPVPKDRVVSREYKANFLSMLTFQWMAPIMTVGPSRKYQLYHLV